MIVKMPVFRAEALSQLFFSFVTAAAVEVGWRQSIKRCQVLPAL